MYIYIIYIFIYTHMRPLIILFVISLNSRSPISSSKHIGICENELRRDPNVQGGRERERTENICIDETLISVAFTQHAPALSHVSYSLLLLYRSSNGIENPREKFRVDSEREKAGNWLTRSTWNTKQNYRLRAQHHHKSQVYGYVGRIRAWDSARSGECIKIRREVALWTGTLVNTHFWYSCSTTERPRLRRNCLDRLGDRERATK